MYGELNWEWGWGRAVGCGKEIVRKLLGGFGREMTIVWTNISSEEGRSR